MAIPEEQLKTWSKQGPTQQFTATYQTIRSVLESPHAPYAGRSFSIFLQGSYANDTNIYADSDVDVVLRLDEVYYSDIEGLSPEDKARYSQSFTSATYSLVAFKAEVIAWLRENYGAAVDPGKKAVRVKGNGTSRRDADVVVCAEFRRYNKFTASWDQSYVEGICFFLQEGTRIENFPKQHSDNCTTKHQGTNHWFKPTVRMYKNARNRLVEKGKIEDGLAPSYYIEGLLYNVLEGQFGGSYQQAFKDVLVWLVAANRTDFVCANEQFYLLREGSHVTWRAEKCTKFLNALVNQWDSWSSATWI